MENNNNKYKTNNNRNNNYRRRSSRYSNNKNNQYNRGNQTSRRSEYNKENKNKDLAVDENYSITKQQKFDFDEMKFSDEIDTSFVENKRKKKKEIVDDLAKSYEKVKVEQAKREKKESHVKIHVGRVIVIIIILALLLALLITSIFVVLRPSEPKVKVVTKEKEVVKIDDNYLFLGDSITERYDLDEYYPDMFVVNSGVSGNVCEDILDNMKERVYQYNPSKVFLLIGTNDIQQEIEEDDIVSNIEKILEEIKENRPYAELYLEAIYPVDEDMPGAKLRTNEEISSINTKLEEYCKDNDIEFIDTYSLLLDEEEDRIKEEYTKDGLHISDEGYEVITKELEKYL